MNLSYNSASAKLYRWFYQTDEMPKTLCPYFWKLVIAWILALPVGIINVPATIMLWNEERGPSTNQGARLFVSLFMYGALFLAFVMVFSISVIWHVYPDHTTFYEWQCAGVLLWIIAILTGITLWIRYLIQKHKNAGRSKGSAKQSSIISEYVKAKYNRYCPKIDWE